MASIGTLNIKFGASAKDFYRLVETLADLYDMVPEWQAAERDKAAQTIHVLFTRMTDVYYTKESNDG